MPLLLSKVVSNVVLLRYGKSVLLLILLLLVHDCCQVLTRQGQNEELVKERLELESALWE